MKCETDCGITGTEMETQYSALGLLALTEPAAAREKILAAYRQAGMRAEETAKALGVHRQTLRRLVEKLGLAKRVERLEKDAEREGWDKRSAGGWPKGRPRDGQARSPGRPKKVV